MGCVIYPPAFRTEYFSDCPASLLPFAQTSFFHSVYYVCYSPGSPNIVIPQCLLSLLLSWKLEHCCFTVLIFCSTLLEAQTQLFHHVHCLSCSPGRSNIVISLCLLPALPSWKLKHRCFIASIFDLLRSPRSANTAILQLQLSFLHPWKSTHSYFTPFIIFVLVAQKPKLYCLTALIVFLATD